jgi:polar amino acid transport system substrate-binding protein
MDGTPLKVLFVESNFGQANLVVNRLRNFNPNFDVDVINGEEYSSEYLSQHRYQAIVLDHQLPRNLATDFISQQKKRGDTTPIVVLSGNARGEVLIQTVNNGSADVVVNEDDYLALLPGVVQKTIEQHKMETRFQTLILNSKRKLQNTFDAITDVIFQIDQNFEITMANKTLANLCNTQPDKLIGRKYTEVFWQGDPSCDNCGITSTFTSREPTNFEETINGQIYEIRSYPIFAEDGSVESVTAYCKDVTEKKRLEKSLIQSEKLVAVGLLSSGIAHELRNPLNIIETARYFINEFLPIDSQEIRDKLEIIRKNVQRASKIINNLLEFSRNSQVEREPLNLRHIIENTIALIGTQLSSHNITFSLKTEQDYFAFFNADSLKQSLLNIIINAIHAMPGGGKLSVSIEPNGPEFINLRIADTGTGISKENMSKIFNPFFTTKEVGIGTGLGLYVTHVVIERDGGKVNVQSKVDEGTVFTLTLPRMREE